MKRTLHHIPFLVVLLLTGGSHAKDEASASSKEEPSGHVFAWPFTDWQEMRPRGGSTKGGEVTLIEGERESWKKLREPGVGKQEQDRRAILAMAGSYRVSFDFVETIGFAPGYKPPRPYFSWGTEYVKVLEDRPGFISMQHALVMYFKDEKGKEQGPHVMKHWRQDWTWEDKELHVYEKNSTWSRERTGDVAGSWSQAVYQVDDSPRYEVMGRWSHEGGMSIWVSDPCPRPLPRREHSVRDDYNVLTGTHEITITPTGWLHVQNNKKLKIGADGAPGYVGQEIGVNRYEEISSPELAPAFDEYWSKTGAYWKAVRDGWAEVYRENDTFTIEEKKDEAQLFVVHFGFADKLQKAGDIAPGEAERHAKETIHRFLKKDAAR